MNTYFIHCEAGDFNFERLIDRDADGLLCLALGRNKYWYEPGDSYLYDKPDGGNSSCLGTVFSYSHSPEK